MALRALLPIKWKVAVARCSLFAVNRNRITHASFAAAAVQRNCIMAYANGVIEQPTTVIVIRSHKIRHNMAMNRYNAAGAPHRRVVIMNTHVVTPYLFSLRLKKHHHNMKRNKVFAVAVLRRTHGGCCRRPSTPGLRRRLRRRWLQVAGEVFAFLWSQNNGYTQKACLRYHHTNNSNGNTTAFVYMSCHGCQHNMF